MLHLITCSRQCDILAKTRSRMTTAITFSRQNDAGSRVSNTRYWEYHVLVGVLDLESKALSCYCKKQVYSNFPWSVLLSTGEITSKCSKLCKLHLSFEDFDVKSTVDKSINHGWLLSVCWFASQKNFDSFSAFWQYLILFSTMFFFEDHWKRCCFELITSKGRSSSNFSLFSTPR